MNAGLFKPIFRDAVILSAAHYIVVSNVRRFLHYITELACLLKAALVFMNEACFNRKGGASHSCPCQASNHTNFLLHCLWAENGLAKEFREVFACNGNVFFTF